MKFLYKPLTWASTIHDAVRFRLVVRSFDDVILTLRTSSRELAQCDFTVPGTVDNSLIALNRRTAGGRPSVARLTPPVDGIERLALQSASARKFRILRLAVDVPVITPQSLLRRVQSPDGQQLGRILVVRAESQFGASRDPHG